MLQIALWVFSTTTFAQSSGTLQEAQQASDQADKLSQLNLEAEALKQLQRALAIREKVLGQDHPLVADCHYKIGESLREQGDLKRAEQSYQRALTIRERSLGSGHIDVAETQMALALLYSKQGDHGRADRNAKIALQNAEKAVAPKPHRLASILRRRAVIYDRQGSSKLAQPLLLRALKILETAHPSDSRALFQVLSSLGSNYYDLGELDQAVSSMQHAQQIAEVTYGPNAEAVALCLINLAELYWTKENYERAAPLAERALKIIEAWEGPEHPDLVEPLCILIRILVAQQRTQDVWPLMQRLANLSERRMRYEGIVLPEARLSSLIEQHQLHLAILCSYLRAQPKNPKLLRLALAAALLQKGRSLEQAAATSQAIYLRLTASDKVTYEKLRAVRSELASSYISNTGSTAQWAKQKELEEQADKLEQELSRRSAPLRARRMLPSLNEVVDRVTAALPADGALVEIVGFKLYPFRPLPPSADQRDLYYLALVLKPGGDIAVADLGPAQAIDRAVTQLLARVASPGTDVADSARAAFHKIMEPLLPLLGSQHHLFLSPDGLLSLLPFAALHDGRTYMLETYQLSYLTSGRDLLSSTRDIPHGRAVVAMADPLFHSVKPAAQPSNRSSWRTARGVRLESLAALPGSRQEAMAIQQLLPAAQLFLGRDARKSVLLSLSAPAVLHVATHGVFFQSEGPLGGTSRGAFLARAVPPGDPLLRSALVLAADSPPSGSGGAAGDNGITSELVTALEIAGMNLWGTQLVVLSACDTGRGDVRLGQGVYGLRRAIFTAGAESLVTSLWKVNDLGTQALMTYYYQELLGGAGRVEAMRKAALTIRAQYPHPYYWAPFIVIGRDAPLQGIP